MDHKPLLRKQEQLEQKIAKYDSVYSSKYKSKVIKKIKSQLEYWIKFQEIVDTYELYKIQQNELELRKSIIEKQIIDKYKKQQDIEIEEETKEIKKQLGELKLKMKLSVKSYEYRYCIKCDKLYTDPEYTSCTICYKPKRQLCG